MTIKPVQHMKKKDAQLIQEIKDYLDEYLYEQHTVKDICKRFIINREKLQNGFHFLVQSTLHAYIVQQRMERAAQRLLTTDDSIKAIALDSGYKKQRSFNKTFKTIFTHTPAAYRNCINNARSAKPNNSPLYFPTYSTPIHALSKPSKFAIRPLSAVTCTQLLT